MSAAVAITPASGAITAKATICKVNVTGAPSNDVDTFDAGNSPSEDAILYYLKLSKAGQDSLVSQRFTTSSDGTFEWDSVIIPASGTWSLQLLFDADDSEAAVTSVSVS